MTNKIRILIATGLLFFAATCLADVFLPQSTYQVCFTPSEDCTKSLVDIIKHAKQKILVQAYTFTSAPIAQALVMAKQRGVDVKIILDKSQINAHYSSATYFSHYGIIPRIDANVQIAHNKIIILDDKTVATGSFNFTKAAQEKNAENLLIITDVKLASKYTENWYKRYNFSVELEEYKLKKDLKHHRWKHNEYCRRSNSK